jgi:predicted metal-dependent hydrolase
VTDRDRDATGRARNARPRDALGRPLAPGQPGVARGPDGVLRAPTESLVEAQRLLDAGLPFHAHEVLEDAWKSAPPELRELWRGLAQLAVGLTHAGRGNRAGARSLLQRGAESISGYRGTRPYDVDVDGLVGWARASAATLEAHPAGPAPDAPRLTART